MSGTVVCIEKGNGKLEGKFRLGIMVDGITNRIAFTWVSKSYEIGDDVPLKIYIDKDGKMRGMVDEK